MKVFLIGCGDIARHHGRAVVRLGGQVIGGFDISQANADLVSQEFGCPCCGYEEIEENIKAGKEYVIRLRSQGSPDKEITFNKS